MNHRHPLLAFAAVLLGLAALLPTASTASAAPPDNDDISGATVLGPVPFHLEQDTTEATTSAEEAAFNDFCGAPAFEHAVWFTATAIADNYVVADVTASDYSAGILVLTGEPGNLTPLICQPGTVSGPVVAGETIYLVVFGDGVSEATSGHLVLDTYLAPPPPSVDVTIDPRGTVDKAGVAHVSGTVSCTSDDPEGILFDVSGSFSSGSAGGSSMGSSAPSSSRRVTASRARGVQTSSPRLASSLVGRLRPWPSPLAATRSRAVKALSKRPSS